MAGDYFRAMRNVELSTIEYLTTQINASWTNITVCKTHQQVYSSSVKVPIVCVRQESVASERHEIGAETLRNDYLLIVDIYAKSDGQLLDLADFILDALKTPWTYNLYSHTSGDDETLTATANGEIRVINFVSNDKLDYGDNVDVKDRYRQTISVEVRKRIY